MNVINIDPKRFPSFAGSGALITGRSSGSSNFLPAPQLDFRSTHSTPTGFGLATAELLSSLSCRVIIADIQPPPPTASPSLHFHRTDVTSYASLLSAFETSFTLFNSYPNIVFANAGINEKGSVFVGVTDEEIKSEPKHEVLEINLRAVANTVRIGWWGIKKNGKQGNIIMTSSVAGYLGVPGLGMSVYVFYFFPSPRRTSCASTDAPFSFGRYTPAEHGVVGMLRTLRPSGPKDKVAISLVAPAITVTPLSTSYFLFLVNFAFRSSIIVPPAGVGLKEYVKNCTNLLESLSN